MEPVQFSDWAASIVPLHKRDGKYLHFCRDYKLTINENSKLDKYPIPKYM